MLHHLLITARKRSLRRLCFYRCLSVHRGGMHDCSRGHAWLLRGGAWLLQGCGRCVWLLRGMHGCSGGHEWLLWGACMVAPGGACVVALGGCAWLLEGCAWDMTRYGDTVNERKVRILLECILVNNYV